MQTGSYKRPIHPMKLIILLSIALLAALIFAVCLARARREAAEGEEAPLAVRLVVSDGLRTLETVTRPARLALTVVNAREGSTYDAVYRIDDGPEYRIRSIRGGEEIDLSYALAFLREYGEAHLKGHVAPSDAPSERIAIDTTVWMSYLPACHFLPEFRVGEKKDYPIGEHRFTVGDEGAIALSYSPRDTFLHVSAEVTHFPSIDCPIVLHKDEASNRDGLFRLPFKIMREGACTLTVLLENGRDRTVYDYRISGAPASPSPQAIIHVPDTL